MILMFRVKKNTAFTIMLPLADSDGQPITGAAGLDSEYSHDGSAFGDCTNEATEIGTTGWYTLALEAAELNYNYVAVRVQSSTAGIMPCHILLQTYEEPFDVANTELASAPAVTDSARKQLQFAFESILNKSEFNKDTGAYILYKADGATTLATATHTDDGTTFTHGVIS